MTSTISKPKGLGTSADNSITDSVQEVKESGEKSQSSIGLSYDEIVRRARERFPEGAGAATDGILRSTAPQNDRNGENDSVGEELRQAEWTRSAYDGMQKLSRGEGRIEQAEPPRIGWLGNGKFVQIIPTAEEMQTNARALVNASPVKTIGDNEFPKSSEGLVDRILRFFTERYANKVRNPVLGDVELTKNGIRDSNRHGMGYDKINAYAAVPEVIQDGKIIHYTENHKNRGYDTYIIAAPVYVRSEKTGELARQYVGAVVKRDGNSQRFYLHEVITEKEPASPITTGASNTGLPNGGQTLSIKSILQQALNVNREGAYASKEASLAGGQWGETPGMQTQPGEERRYENRSAGNRVVTQPKPAASNNPSAENASVEFNIPQSAENSNVNGSSTDGILRSTAPQNDRGAGSPTDGILRDAQDDSGRQDGGAAARGFAERYGYGEHGRSVLNEMIESGSVSPDAVNQAFHLPYLWGMSNKARSEVELTSPIQEEAFNAGRLDRILSMKRSADTVTVWGKKSGLIENELTKKLPRQTRESLHAMGNALGAKIVVEHIPAEQNANGYYRSSDGTIHIDANTTDPVMTVAKHEITHRMQELAPEAYTQFRDYAVQMENRGAEFGNLSAVEIKQEQYREGSGGKVNLDVEAAMDEIAANYTEKILRDERTLHDFVREMSRTEEKRSVGQKFFDAVHEFLRKLKEHFGKGKKARAKMDAEAVDAFGATVSELERAERLWKKAYSEAVQAAQSEAGQAQKNTAQTDGVDVRYSINESFASEIDAWVREGRRDGETFILGNTGPVLQGLGAIESDIYMEGDKINTILEEHPEMTLNEIKRIPEVLEDPVLVLKSQNKGRNPAGNSRLVMFGAVKAQDGRPVMCVLDLRPTENGLLLDDMQKVSSAYTKDNAPVSFVERSYVMHADRKRTIPLLRSIGFRMPMALLHHGSIGNISYAGTNVKMTGDKFSDVVATDGKLKSKSGMMSGQANNTEKQSPTSDPDIRFSLKEYTEQEKKVHVKTALEYFGKTYSWKETGYLTPSGNKIDFSGRHDGAPGGYRTVDHRDISDALGEDYGGDDYSGAMVQFMAEGNIRISPESNGINLAVKPTRSQEAALSDFISRAHGEVVLDIDEPGGDTVVSVEYPMRTRASKIFADINNWFDKGEKPYVSELAQFHFSLKGQKELERENAKLRETVAGLREQFRRTKLAKVDRKALDSFAKTLLKDYQSSADVEETRAALDSLYTYLANGENGEGPVWGEAYRRAFETAAGILESASVTEDEVYRQYSRLRRYLREQKMHVPREMWSEFDSAGGYNALRRAYMGRLSLSSKDGAGIDQVYQELSQMYPEFFDEAEISNPADQLLRIAEVLDGLEPYEVNPYSTNMRESASWLANDILERFYELPQAKPTFADKAEGRLTDQVIRDGKKLEKLRGQKNARIAQLIAENRQKVKEAAARERQKRKREVDELKATVRTLQHMLKAAQDGGVDSRTMDAYREKVLKGYRGGSDTGVRLAIMSLEPKDRQAVLAEYEKLVKDYGAIPAGEKPAREVQVPKKTAPGKKVSQTVRTVLEAGATPEGAIPTIEQMVADGTFSYDAYTDEQAMADAGSTIERDGFETALSDWLGRMMRGEVSKKNTAMGWVLYNNAANAGDIKTAMTVLNQMASMILMGRYMQRRTAYPEMFISTFWIRWTRWISRRKAGSSALTRRTRRRRRSGS